VLRDHVEGLRGGVRSARPDLQAIMLRSCEEPKKKIWNWDVEVERWMINCSIPLILIGIQTIGALWIEIPTSTSLGDFLGLSLSRQWNESKKNSKQNSTQPSLSVYSESVSNS
jgi:hypothetical protein